MSDLTYPALTNVIGEKLLWKATGLTYGTVALSGDEWHFLNAGADQPDAVGSTVEKNSSVIPLVGPTVPAALFHIDVTGVDHLTIEGSFTMTNAGGITAVTSDNLRAAAAGVTHWAPGDPFWGVVPTNLLRDLAFSAWDDRVAGMLGLCVQGQDGTASYNLQNTYNLAMTLAKYTVLPPGNNLNEINRWRIQIGMPVKSAASPGAQMAPHFNVKQLQRVWLTMRHLPVVVTGGTPTISGEIKAIFYKDK